MNKIVPLVMMTMVVVGIGLVFISQKAISEEAKELPTLSKLSVSGNRIVNEEGQEIRLRGVNFQDPFLQEKDDFDYNGDGMPDNHFANIDVDFARVKKLGANVVRLTIWPGYYRLVGGEKYLATYVDRMVDLAEENGLYAIISYQAIGRPGGWYSSDSDGTLWQYPAKVLYTDTDMAVEFWNTVAARYGKRKHVLFEIYNEPADETSNFTWADWRPTGELLIATIRQHSDNIVLGPGLNYTNDLSAVPTNPYSDSNLVYVAHVYPNTVPKGEDQVSEWERLFGFLAKTYPVIVSEWGFHDGGKDETTSGTLKGFGRPLLDYLDQKNIPWVAYGYFPLDGEPPMLEADWTTLNEFGEFVKERLQKSAPLRAGVTLKTLAEQRGIRFGSLFQYDIRNDVYDQVFTTEMNALTIGTFWGDHPSRTTFNFSSTDATVNWGRARGMELYGQTLVWFEDIDGIPDWLKATPAADVEAVMNEYIDTMVGRYAGKIKAWNVVNEAVDSDGTLRQNHKWVEAMGNDYIRKAFVRAHAADPTAVLYYNEYDIESNQAKFDGTKALLINLKNQGAPVQALGWQLHVKPSSFDAATLLARMNEIADLDFDNYITELDVELPANAREADYEQQKQTYKTIVETFLAARRHKTIVVWGLRDGDPYWLTNGHPLLFDEHFRKKPAYLGAQEALK